MNTTNRKGDIAQQKVVLRAFEKGIIPSKPLVDDSRYDFVFDVEGKIRRVQVKYCDSRPKNSENSYSVSLTKHTGGYSRKLYRYTKDDFDDLIVYFPSENRYALLPSKTWSDKSSVTIRFQPAKNGQKKNIILIDDYEW